jgi:hypothetical protein
MGIDTRLAVAIFGSTDLVKALDSGEELSVEEFSTGRDNFFPSSDENPVKKVIESSLAKRAGVSDAGWDAALTTAPAAVTSEARFEKVCAKIRVFFAAVPGAAEQAIEIARTLRTQVRAEIIAKA